MQELDQQQNAQSKGHHSKPSAVPAVTDDKLLQMHTQIEGRLFCEPSRQQAWQAWQQRAPVGGLLSQLTQQSAPPELIGHPALQIRLGGAPEIEIGIEVTAQSFYIEQGLLQQDQLRLDLNVEAPRGGEQAQQ